MKKDRTITQRGRRRVQQLNALAQRAGFATWRLLETAALHGMLTIQRTQPDRESVGDYLPSPPDGYRIMKGSAKIRPSDLWLDGLENWCEADPSDVGRTASAAGVVIARSGR